MLEIGTLVGVAFVAWFVLVVFFTPRIDYRISRPPRLDSDEFLHVIQATCQATVLGGNRVEILTNGSQFYPAMLDAVRAAQASVNLEAYILQPGEIADRFVDALVERARAGVEVRVVLDSIGSSRISGAPVRRLRSAGCQVNFYQSVTVYRLHRLNNRTQRHQQGGALVPRARCLSVNDSDLALVLSGGGARAAYQVGFLRYLASRYPNLTPGILTGVSAGGIIATCLASRKGSFRDSVAQLHELWRGLQIEDVFRVDPTDLASRVTRWGLRLVSGGARGTPRSRSLVNTAPLDELLTRTLGRGLDGTIPGIAGNLACGRLRAVALTASSYTTGQSVTWVQSVEGCGVLTWERPQRKSINGCLRVDHVMASSALPFFFPAIEIDGAWYGGGGIRLTAPLSPAIHLGARKIIAVSTRYPRTRNEAGRPAVAGYPPPAQVAGVLASWTCWMRTRCGWSSSMRCSTGCRRRHEMVCGMSICWSCGPRKIWEGWPTNSKRTCRVGSGFSSEASAVARRDRTIC